MAGTSDSNTRLSVVVAVMVSWCFIWLILIHSELVEIDDKLGVLIEQGKPEMADGR